MKINIKNISMFAVVATATLATTSCNDLLDLEPVSQITPESYYKSADQLASYLNKYYDSYIVSPFASATHGWGGWHDGKAASDQNTDIFVKGLGGNTTKFADNHWEVSAGKVLQDSYGGIRTCNYLIGQVEKGMAAKSISGDPTMVNNCLGEAYFMRAMLYFNLLANYGDIPVVKKVLIDNNDSLVAVSQRVPRNEVARFILSDLDVAAKNLYARSVYNGQRLNKEAALLFKSRVALFEGTFEKYHQGSGRVPGDANWPGAKMAYNSGKKFDIPGEIKFFLEQAKEAAKQVGSTITASTHKMQPAVGTPTGWNAYFEMFSQPALDNVPEVLLWKQYSRSLGYTHDVPYRVKVGCADGYTRAFVESFLMKSGKPKYADSNYKGDVSIADAKEGRDERLQLFVWDEKQLIDTDPTSPHSGKTYDDYGKDEKTGLQTHITNTNQEIRCITGYQPRKYYTYDYTQTPDDNRQGTDACPIFRVSEAMLNYMEADCELNNGNSIDETSKAYWKALRERAGVSPDFDATIAATDLNKEVDFGVYSGTNQVSKMLYNIRRERMNEMAGEGLRYADLIRWRSFDRMITKKWIPEGVNFWTEMYKSYGSDLKADESSDALVSSKAQGLYIRPYSRSMAASNELRDGYNWHEAYYLSPLGISDLRTAAADRDLKNSQMYQNVNWPAMAGGHAEK